MVSTAEKPQGGRHQSQMKKALALNPAKEPKNSCVGRVEQDNFSEALALITANAPFSGIFQDDANGQIFVIF